MVAGGCHCRAVRFTVALEAPEIIECNCSICTMKGFAHLIVSSSALTIQQGGDALSEYRFNTHTARHTFCRFCGVQPFYVPRSHPDGYSVNANCLDDRALVESMPRTTFDGRNWEAHINEIR
ncbi:MAG: aldehyde-activating protein [Deltaproteobacteria bacterium]|nr:aldehyde-activating protein [Deltaproteobacteria bacterium]HCH65694.1 aldehyde-activating protein [Deltaproteobacteria bacterium]|tara:strand:- start:119 stop:484 length:366 start_codon:yes stop_codon:yes gene_type:complete